MSPEQDNLIRFHSSRWDSPLIAATVNASGVTLGPSRTLENARDQIAGVAIGCLQEVAPLRGAWALRARLSRLLGVAQSDDSIAHGGVAVVWEKARCRARRQGIAKMSGKARGIRARYLVWVDLELGNGATIRVGSTHRPPARFRHLWDAFDGMLRAFVLASPHPVLIGMDANAGQLPNLSGLPVTFAHRGIDGFLVSEDIDAGECFPLGATGSDHQPIAIRFHAPDRVPA